MRTSEMTVFIFFSLYCVSSTNIVYFNLPRQGVWTMENGDSKETQGYRVSTNILETSPTYWSLASAYKWEHAVGNVCRAKAKSIECRHHPPCSGSAEGNDINYVVHADSVQYSCNSGTILDNTVL